MKSGYGWEAIPRGTRDDRTRTADEQRADSCGLLQAFYDRGFDTAWSMYAYYGGPYSASMQANIVAGCFAFGRAYRVGANPLPVPAPFIVKVFSINGGRCGDTTLPCSGVSSPIRTRSHPSSSR